MRVLQINSVCGIRSTGRICTDIAEQYTVEGHEVKIAYGRGKVPEHYQKYAVRIGTKADQIMHCIRTRLFDEHGLGSRRATKQFLKWAEKFNPDILWLHNLHGYYINIEMLFDWIKKRPYMQVKWTLHDCWAFTGHCSHFTVANCEQWKERCTYCTQKKQYPTSILKDNCRNNYERKKKAFTGVYNMILITPSKWLADLVQQSYLKGYSIEVHYNTIDTRIFKPTPSDFREVYALQDKTIVLGVSNVWNESKGLFDFIKLSKILDERYVIVLVGLSKKQLKTLPKHIVGVPRTNSTKELAEIYTAADVFFNPTYEDTYPTVNLEAEACGTPVITYKTGGAPETIHRGDSRVIEVGNYEVVQSII